MNIQINFARNHVGAPSGYKQGKSEGFDSCDWPSNLAQIRSEPTSFGLCDLEIWWMALKINKGSSSMLLQAMCVISRLSVNSNWNYSLKMLNLGQIWQFLSHMTLKFDGWHWKTMGHLFYATKLVHHFIAIGEFKLELWSRNPQFGSKLVIFFPVWPLNLMVDL